MRHAMVFGRLIEIERARRRAGWRPWWRVTTRAMGPDAVGVVRRMRAVRRGEAAAVHPDAMPEAWR